jgi:hypothetical protein
MAQNERSVGMPRSYGHATGISVVFVIALFFVISVAFATDSPGQVTTYSALTGKNTSAANGPSILGTPSENVSKAPISSLLPSGSSARIYAHLYVWFGTASHQDVGYSSSDAVQVQNQVDDMLSRGINGVIVNWRGGSDSTDQAAQVVMAESERHAGSFQFAIEEDAKALAQCAATSGCDLVSQVTRDLNYVGTTYSSAGTYMKYQGHPVIFLLGMEAYNLDWTKISAAVSGSPVFVFRTAPAGQTAKSTVSPPATDPADVIQDTRLSAGPLYRTGVENA